MPALLVGFGPDLPSFEKVPWSSLTSAIPPWLVWIDQQAGGMATNYYPSAFGALLRLSANAAHAHRDPIHLVAGFHCMAQDPQLDILARDHPHLRQLCATWGSPFGPDDLRHLRTATEACFRLPRPVGGREAFVEYELCNPLDYFEGWNVVGVSPDVESFECQQQRYGELWQEDGHLDPELLGALTKIGSEVLPGQPLRIFLLWENSD